MARQISEVILNFVEGENEGVEIRVGNKLPRTLTLGRSEECDIFLGEKKISRKHCQIVVQPQRVFLKDLQSTNGTFVNKERVDAECDLKTNDRVQVGTTVIRMTIEEAAPQASVPEIQSTLKITDVADDLAALSAEESGSGEIFPGVSRSGKSSEKVIGSGRDELSDLSEFSDSEFPVPSKTDNKDRQPAFAPIKAEKSSPMFEAVQTRVSAPPAVSVDEDFPQLSEDDHDEDVEEFLETVPKRRETDGQKPLSGSLAAMGLADLLQSLAQNHKSGTLKLDGVSRGELVLLDGQLIHAALGDVEGPKALYRMLAWNDGEFELAALPAQARSGAMKASLTGKIESLLMEGFRQHDEFEKLRPRLPDEHAKLSMRSQLKAKLSELHPKVLDVLQVIWNEKIFQNVLDKSPFSDLETAKMVYYLIKKEYIVAQ